MMYSNPLPQYAALVIHIVRVSKITFEFVGLSKHQAAPSKPKKFIDKFYLVICK